MKFVFVTGGVVSGLGKGITAASIGKLLKSSGYRVNIIKLDPYLQIDAGTMSPYEHGEVFVTEDGFETDLDLGHYERFLNQNITKASSITTGRIYQTIIAKERKGDYLGQTVQVIPHVTDEIKHQLIQASKGYDVTIVEIGGTIGDIEGPHFIEAIRQMRKTVGQDNVMYVHVVPLFVLSFSGETKTKPIQHSVKELTRMGIHADMIMCRTPVKLTKKTKDKIALFCDVDPEYIIEAKDLKSIYQVPQYLADQKVDILVQEKLHLEPKQTDLTKRNQRTNNFLHPERTVRIGITGKYAELTDAYLSVEEACKHAGAEHKTKIELIWISAEDLEHDEYKETIETLRLDGLIIPGGFGNRGMEGKINAISRARTHNVPFLGLCLGLQMAVVEFARNVCHLPNAHTIEYEETCDPIISRMPGQSEEVTKGGSMRLGGYTTKLDPDSQVHALYTRRRPEGITKNCIIERHRHRFEVNPDYHTLLQKHGLKLSGRDRKTDLVEFIELPSHPYFIATQAHPEFTSRLEAPNPLFVGLIEACLQKLRHANY